MSETRTFPLADVLSVTTSMLLTRGGGAALGDILGWMTGDDLAWWQAPRAADACIEAFAAEHPFLVDLKPPPGLDQADLYAWLVAAETEHGADLTVSKLADWVHQSPAAELVDRVDLANVKVISAD